MQDTNPLVLVTVSPSARVATVIGDWAVRGLAAEEETDRWPEAAPLLCSRRGEFDTEFLPPTPIAEFTDCWLVALPDLEHKTRFSTHRK